MKLSLQLGTFSFAVGSERSAMAMQQRSSTNSLGQDWLRGQEGNSSTAHAALASPFQQSVWVYTVISALAQTVSAIPFRISQGDRSGQNLLTNGAVIDLFNRPHEYLNRFRFWEFIVTWYCLRGEVFIVALDKSGNVLPISRSHAPTLSRSNAPASLLVLPPDQFRHIVNGYDLAGWQFYSSPMSGPLPPQSFSPNDVLHDFLPNPYLFWRGMSPLSVAMLAAQTDYASAQFMKGLMLNNADTGVIVQTAQQLSPEQREELMAALRDRKRSAGTADRPLVLSGGTQIIKPALASADLQFLEHRKFNRQEICAAFFRMPQSLVGFTEDANRAIHQSERLNFIENSITPFCARLEAAVEPIIKCFGADLFGWFDIDSLPILQQARRDRVDTGVKLFNLGYPANAINKTLDLGLPHLTWGDKGYLPSRLQEVGAGVGEAPPTDANEQGVFERLGALLLENGKTRERENESTRSEKRVGVSECRSNGGNVTPALRHPETTRLMRSRLSSFFFDQRGRVLAALGAGGAGGASGALGALGASEREHTPTLARSDAPTLPRPPATPLDTDQENQLLFQKLAPLLRGGLEAGFVQGRAERGFSDSTLPLESIASFLLQRQEALKEVNQVTSKVLQSSLQDGLANGEAFPALGARVRRIFQDASDRRAGSIASTEIKTAFEAGRRLVTDRAIKLQPNTLKKI